MFEKEAEDFLKKYLKVDNDEFDFFKDDASCKAEIKRLADFVEPREKRISELEKENARLRKESEENQDLVTIAYMQGASKNKAKLDEAKEIIRLFLSERFNESEWQNIQGKAEAFLKEYGK